MKTASVTDQNWEYLLGLLPANWRELARTTKAITRLRGFAGEGELLRALLMHVALGCSLRDTVVVAKAAGWLALSDVALLKKLRQSEAWLQALCVGVLRDSALAVPATPGLRMRLIDGTHVKEPGQTGSQWRMHFSLQVPEWSCDYFAVTGTEGAGTGESLSHFPVRPQDCLIADRGYGHAVGLGHVQRAGGYCIVRHSPQNLPLENKAGGAVDVLGWLRGANRTGQIGSRRAYVRIDARQRVAVRLCVVRKSAEAIVASERKVRRRAQKNGETLRPETLEYAQWVIVLTTVPAELLSTAEVLAWYRMRWQIELAFKRLKSLAGFGHLPKYDPRSSRAWLYGKLLVALLTDKLQRYAGAFSPWGVRWDEPEAA